MSVHLVETMLDSIMICHTEKMFITFDLQNESIDDNLGKLCLQMFHMILSDVSFSKVTSK